MALAAIALGSNLPQPAGSREANLLAAVERVARLGTIRAVSNFADTEPVGYLEQPRFLNAALVLETELPPPPLLEALLAIEREGGRDRSHAIAKGPRSIDLDLLLYDEIVCASPLLQLPHPELHRRRFVLAPLAEIVPGMMHPVLLQTVLQILASLPADVS